MKYFKCENCGSELTETEGGTYICSYCKRTYYPEKLDKAYQRIYQNLVDTVEGAVTEMLLQEKIDKIASCRQGLYRALNGQFIDRQEVLKWSKEILKLLPDDPQAKFYEIATEDRFSDLNKFMSRLSAREASHLVEGFVEYLTNGRFVEQCALALSDLIGRAFSANSKEYADCHKKINAAAENEKSGIFDVELPRDVFVAYSSKDKEQAYELVEYLEQKGFTCFVAMRNLAKGLDAELKYNERLKKAIDNCKVFALVSSKNSRSRNCDAYKIEMRYVKNQDVARAENSDYASLRYELYLEKNRTRCKPRVEYLIEEYGPSVYEQEVKKFFGGLTWCTELNAVAEVVQDYVENYEELTNPTVKGSATLEALRAKLASLEEAARRENEERRLKREFDERKQAAMDNCNVVGDTLWTYRGDDEELWVPDGVERIRSSVFENCTALKKIHFPNTLKEIWSKAFENCVNLKEIILPDSVEEIRSQAFLNCKSLEKIELGKGLKELGAAVFQGCDSLKELVLPKSLEKMLAVSLYQCPAVVYAEAEKKPEGWVCEEKKIIWGYKEEQTK